jgi:hypothetical protein
VSEPLTFNSGSTFRPGGGQPGALTVNSNLVMSTGSTLSLRFAGNTPGTGFGYVMVNGTVTLNNATLSVDTTGLSPGSTKFFIVVNDGTDPITGTFNNLPNNSTVTLGAFTATVSYFGDSTSGAPTGGNDVVLYNFTQVPEPGRVLGVATLLALLAARRRRHP